MINPPVVKAGGFFGDKQSMKIKGDLTKAKLVTLGKSGESDIYRVSI